MLLLTLHHIVSDGWSVGGVQPGVCGAVCGVRAGQENPLPPLPVQYADFALWQREWLDGAALDRAGVLAGAAGGDARAAGVADGPAAAGGADVWGGRVQMRVCRPSRWRG